MPNSSAAKLSLLLMDSTRVGEIIREGEGHKSSGIKAVSGLHEPYQGNE
jgi:hypothetical protein